MRPFSQSAGIENRGYSKPLQRVTADFGSDNPFAKVLEKLREHYGITIPSHAPRTITEEHARKIREMEVLQNELEGNGCAAIIVEVDGSMVPLVKIASKTSDDQPSDGRKRRKVGWEEARLVLAHKQGSVSPKFGATMGTADEAGDHMVNCVILAGGGEKSKVHCVGDGATWINDQVNRVFPEQGKFLVDFYHLCEYLAHAAVKCSPIDSKAWLEKQKEQMKKSNVSAVLDALIPYIELESIKDQDAPVRKCIRYIANRPGQFEYKMAIEAELPIGSGEIESGHRYIIQKRLKLPGAWWKAENADNMLALRTLRANGGWDDYWTQQFKLAA